jgi:indole-3-glycerol phosphate synthase/phosphoribosylanthranilate isomerase/anthranilate synthase/indole-3-glycerol phosphate synthase/phosphoribosylanthranilate isomerase
MTRVKICGIKRVEDGLVAAEAGADLLGFVFAPSRRQIDPDTARAIALAVRARSSLELVGVFVNAKPAEMNRVAKVCGLDYLQLSGDEPDEIIAALDVPAIRAIHVRDNVTPEWLAERVEGYPAELILLDTARKGVYGGTGTTFDWRRIPSLDRSILLAGGLHPGNVEEAIRTVRPWGVDVSSGVETNGAKDPDKIRAFVQAARRIVG